MFEIFQADSLASGLPGALGRVLLKSRNSEGMERAFGLGNLKERKEAALSVNAEGRPDGAIYFLKRENVILNYIRVQLTVILILLTIISKDQL